MEARIIEKFTQKLVPAICDCIRPVATACMANGLIHGDTCDDILGSTDSNKEKTRRLVEAVRNCTEVDDLSFGVFLDTMESQLPKRRKATLLLAMRRELAKAEQAQTVDGQTNECKDLLPMATAHHRIVTSASHRQLSVLHTQGLSSSTGLGLPLLSQEQNPLIGKLEEATTKHAYAIIDKKLLEDQLTQNERLRAQLTKIGQLSVPSLPSGTESQQPGTSSLKSEADILQMKEKIEELEQKSIELDMAIKRYRRAIHIKGEEVMLMAQREIEFQYKQKFQELVMNLKRENQRYPASSYDYSRAGSDDDDVSPPKQAKTASTSGNETIENDGGRCVSTQAGIVTTSCKPPVIARLYNNYS